MDDFKEMNVLICDDSITNALILMELIEKQISTHTITLTDPRKIAPTLKEQQIDMMLLDLEMPYLSGFEVMEQVRLEYTPDQLPILVITGVEGKETRNKALANGANDFLNKPIDQVEVELRVKNLLKVRKSYIIHEKNNQILEQKVKQRTIELNHSIDALLHDLAMAGELKDNDTGKHVIRVGKYARILADGYGLPEKVAAMVELTAPLHDIGKIGIPDKILLKPARLDQDEKKIMDQHTLFAKQLISSHESPLIQMAKTIALNHHERWDGEGYPEKIKGESIPIEGRITAIADVFDALTTQRPYKKAWPFAEAVHYIKDQAGHAFDPALVTVFMNNLPKIEKVKKEFSD